MDLYGSLAISASLISVKPSFFNMEMTVHSPLRQAPEFEFYYSKSCFVKPDWRSIDIKVP
jgi:hypothetical protein